MAKQNYFKMLKIQYNHGSKMLPHKFQALQSFNVVIVHCTTDVESLVIQHKTKLIFDEICWISRGRTC